MSSQPGIRHSPRVAPLSTAAKADKYRLFTAAVQNSQADVRFFSTLYEHENDKPPLLVREDFCGTAAISCEWIRSRDSVRAVGVDVDAEPLQWCREHLQPEMTSDEVGRLELIRADVLEVETPRVDIILAPNTSICLLKPRSQLLQYLSRCRATLKPRGIMVIDVYAGPDAHRTGVDRIVCDDFVCLWEQSAFNAATNEAMNKVHFLFSDGSRIADAFVYHMRMWSLAELSDALRDAGFRCSCVYRKTSDLSADAESLVSPVQTADVPESWEAYVAGFV